jgi:hypothetical protein
VPATGVGAKAPLAPGSAALLQYVTKKNQLLLGNYLTSPSCSAFFNNDPLRAAYYGQLTDPVALVNGTDPVSRQIPYDGSASNISMYDAGMSDGKNANDVRMKKRLPVCSLFVPFHGPYGTVRPLGLAWAASQMAAPAGGLATDVYFNTDPKALMSITQGTILHEVLHNLTGLFDFVDLDWRSRYGYQPPYDLKTFVGIEPKPGADPKPGSTNDITVQLRTNGCAGAN